jgi:putative zinc finger/helix-turn-helix YgiT family protein
MKTEENKGTDRCSNCGKPAHRVRRNYLFRESGMPNVTLKDIQVVTCDDCGNNDPIIPRSTEVIRALVLATVKKPRPLSGEDVRFLRKRMDMNGETLAQYLGVDKTTLSKWENNQIQIGASSDRLIRAVALGFGPHSKEEIEDALRGFKAIDETGEPIQIEIDANALAVRYE